MKWRGHSNHGAEQRSLHLFGSCTEMSSISHYASGNVGEAQPEVYEKQRAIEGLRTEQTVRGVKSRSVKEKNELDDMTRQKER